MNNVWIKGISIVEIIGGVVGILFMVYVAVSSDFALNVMVIIPIGLAIFVLSLIAGVSLWRNTEFGRKVSIVVQFLQLVKVMSPAFTFMFSFGFDLFPHLTLVDGFSTIGIQFRFLADGQFFLMSEGRPIFIGVSIPAIIALIKLQNYRIEDSTSASEPIETPPGPGEYFPQDATTERD